MNKSEENKKKMILRKIHKFMAEKKFKPNLMKIKKIKRNFSKLFLFEIYFSQ